MSIKEEVKVYTLDEIADLLGTTKRSLYRYVQSGKLKAVKIARVYRVSEDNLQRFLNGDTETKRKDN